MIIKKAASAKALSQCNVGRDEGEGRGGEGKTGQTEAW